jgi:glutathione S-transferase
VADYDLYYWPVPFRGQFIRAILAYAGKSWDEHDAAEIGKMMTADPEDQPVPFMGPPVLIDTRSGFAIAEMPAIAVYLGTTLNLMPESAELRAMTAKIVNDANDVIDELTLDGGREMWTPKSWEEFVPRLKRWMTIWEATGTRHGLREDGGYFLGTETAGVADIVTSTLWSTMADRFPAIGNILNETAPGTAALSRRLQDVPSLAVLNKTSIERYGDAYCGGEIEKSLRRVI